MSSLYPIPGFGTGFARNASQSLFPSLWNGLKGLWAPYVGNQGQILYDWSTNRNDGLLTNITNNDWVPGKEGLTVRYNGASSLATLSNSSLIGTGLGNSFSISLWFNATSITRFDTFFKFGAYNANNNGLAVGIDDSSSYYVDIFGSPSFYSPAATINTGTWYHVVLTADGTNFRLYHNSSLIDTTARNPNIAAGSSILGWSTVLSRYFHGLLGTVGVWDHILLPAEIALLYAIPHAPLIPVDDLMAFLVPVPAEPILVADKLFKTPGREAVFRTPGRQTVFKTPGREAVFRTPGKC